MSIEIRCGTVNGQYCAIWNGTVIVGYREPGPFIQIGSYTWTPNYTSVVVQTSLGISIVQFQARDWIYHVLSFPENAPEGRIGSFGHFEDTSLIPQPTEFISLLEGRINIGTLEEVLNTRKDHIDIYYDPPALQGECPKFFFRGSDNEYYDSNGILGRPSDHVTVEYNSNWSYFYLDFESCDAIGVFDRFGRLKSLVKFYEGETSFLSDWTQIYIPRSFVGVGIISMLPMTINHAVNRRCFNLDGEWSEYGRSPLSVFFVDGTVNGYLFDGERYVRLSDRIEIREEEIPSGTLRCMVFDNHSAALYIKDGKARIFSIVQNEICLDDQIDLDFPSPETHVLSLVPGPDQHWVSTVLFRLLHGSDFDPERYGNYILQEDEFIERQSRGILPIGGSSGVWTSRVNPATTAVIPRGTGSRRDDSGVLRQQLSGLNPPPSDSGQSQMDRNQRRTATSLEYYRQRLQNPIGPELDPPGDQTTIDRTLERSLRVSQNVRNFRMIF